MSEHQKSLPSWIPQRRDLRKGYERLERHVRTSMSVNELLHWESERAKSRFSGSYNKPLQKAIRSRMRKLREVTA